MELTILLHSLPLMLFVHLYCLNFPCSDNLSHDSSYRNCTPHNSEFKRYDFIDFSSFFFSGYLTLSCGASGTVLQPEP